MSQELKPINELLPTLVKGHPLQAAKDNWAILEAEARKRGITHEWALRGLLATVLVETGHTLCPIREYGNRAYFKRMYWDRESKRKELGNIVESDSFDYCGKGFIQLTGRYNYEKMAKHFNRPLLSQPELLYDPHVSAEVAVHYWRTHGCDVWSVKASQQPDAPNRRRCWEKVRRLVNGGTNHLDVFLKDLTTLGVG